MLLLILCVGFIGTSEAMNPPIPMSTNSTKEMPLQLQNVSRIDSAGKLIIEPNERGLFLPIWKPLSEPFSFTFKVKNPALCPNGQLIKMDWGWNTSITVALQCNINQAILGVLGQYTPIQITGSECKADIKISPSNISISNASTTMEVSKISKFDSAFTVAVTVENSPCSCELEFGPQHSFAIFGPPAEEEKTTTPDIESSTDSTVPPTTISAIKNDDEANSDAGILWVLVFVFSGAFSAAFGGVCCFLCIRCKKQQSERKNNLSDDIHTALEQQPSVSQKVASKSSVKQPNKV